jgi:hypothetical protein
MYYLLCSLVALDGSVFVDELSVVASSRDFAIDYFLSILEECYGEDAVVLELEVSE